jgi:hypothetical protein
VTVDGALVDMPPAGSADAGASSVGAPKLGAPTVGALSRETGEGAITVTSDAPSAALSAFAKSRARA